MSNIKAAILELAETFIVSFIVIYLTYQFVASMEIVAGASMEPNFSTGDRILVDKVSPYFKNCTRGEVVVLIPDHDKPKHLIKRVIGLPGDIVKILDCKVSISNQNGQFVLDEPYLFPKTCTTVGVELQEGRSLRLKDEEYLVLGDNRPYSVDSRFFGVVTTKDILGRVIFRFWPAKKVGFL